MCGKCRVVTTAMLCMKHKCDIKNLGLKLCILAVRTKHQQDILCKGKSLLRITDKECFIFSEMAVCVIGVNRDLRKLGNQLQRLAEHIRYGNILRIIIICIKSKYAALHGIHNVGIGSLHDNITYKTSSQIFHIREKFQEPGQLIFTWKFTEDQKIDRFLKAKTSVLQTVYDILYIDSLIIQFTVCRNTSAIDQLISGNIRNFSKTGKYTFTCRITKASFYIIFHIEIGINVVMLQQLLLKEFHSAFQLFGVLQTHHFMLFFHNLFLVSPLYIKKH